MMLVNGVSKEHISVTDRGFQYGDGLFETIAVANGQAVFLDRHLSRLNAACLRLSLPFPGNELLTSEAETLSRHSTQAVLKIILTRGVGGRGYRQPAPIQTTRVLSLHPFPDYPASYHELGVVLRFCSTRLGLNPTLAGMKHLNRLEQVLARAEWNDDSIQEGIMMDINGHVIEGTMTNLFYVKHNAIFTAALTSAGIAGIVRGIVMELAVSLGLPVIECAYIQADLLAADEVFVCNSVIGIWPVKQIDGIAFAVGQNTRRLQEFFGQLQLKVVSNAG